MIKNSPLQPSVLVPIKDRMVKRLSTESSGIRVLGAYRGDASGYFRISAPFSVLRYRTPNDFDVGNPTPTSADDYDVLWLQQHAEAVAEIVARDFRDAGKKVVYDVDDWIFGLPASWPCYAHFFRRGSGDPTDRLHFHERLLELADVVTCTTEYLAEKLRWWLGDDEKRIVVLPNYILRGDWDTIVPMKHGLDGPVLGWFGTENHWDDWTEIVDAVDEALEEVSGYLALFGASELVTMFPERLAQRTMLHPATSMSRFDEMRELISACDVGLAWCTNRYESCKCRSPLKAVQYGAAGVPVVASRTVYGDIPEFAERFGRIVDNSNELMDTLIVSLNEDRESLEQWGSAWRAEVWQNHTYERQAMQWLELLEEIC